MNGPTKSFYWLMGVAMACSWTAILSGDNGVPLLPMALWSLMFGALALLAPVIYVYAKADYDIRHMTTEDFIKAYYDK